MKKVLPLGSFSFSNFYFSGLDVPECNLVIRFNKPKTFSSYLQSKGRARAREGKASFILFRDESDVEEYSSNREEYQNYELMEKVRII